MTKRLFYRVTGPTIAVGVLVLAIDGYAGWQIHHTQRETSQALMDHVSSMRAAEDLEIRMRDVRNVLNRYLRTRDRTHLDAIPSARGDVDTLLARARELAATSEELAMLDVVERGYLHFFAEIDRLAPQAPREQALAAMGELIDSLMADEIFRPARDYVEHHRDEVAAAAAANRAWADRMGLGLLALGVCGCLAGLVAGFGIARGLSRSIVQLSVSIHGAADKLEGVVGPLTVRDVDSFEGLERSVAALSRQVESVVARLQEREREVLRGEQLAAVGQLAAGLAHELRNPLMPIRLLVQAAAERFDDGGLSQRDLAVLDEEITRLDRSIQMFLDFARPPRLDRRTFDVREIVDQTVELLRGRAARQRATIELALPSQPVSVFADAAQIRQVVLNLLLNALDSIPGGGTIDVAVRDGDEAEIEVVDSGNGIPDELLARVFEPFVSTKDSGSGLGLSICKRIAQAHGGRIVAANQPGRGASLRVWLPHRAPSLTTRVLATPEVAHG